MREKEEKIFEALHIELIPYADICLNMEIRRRDLTKLDMKFMIARSSEIKEIRRIRQLYHNKKRLAGFKFINFINFYQWYKKTYEEQNGKCYYCKIEGKKIAELFSSKIFTSARSSKRGNHLEIDRIDPNNNKYSSSNCVLACYFCNNDKSDVFNECDYINYLNNRKEYFNKKYQKISKKKDI